MALYHKYFCNKQTATLAVWLGNIFKLKYLEFKWF